MTNRTEWRIHVIDSHTGGEPTRVVVDGGPPLGGKERSLADRLRVIRAEHDRFRSAIVNEPRGSDATVGALLCEPHDPSCVTGVLFFNNVGFLGMCGHGVIGVVATLAYLNRIEPGVHRIETPVGIVTVTLDRDGAVSFENVASYRFLKDASILVEGYGEVTGDVAWGGNWFFLTGRRPCELTLANVETLTDYAWRIREALRQQGIAGADGAEIDHIEIFGLPGGVDADSRNFVLCPGKSYDRSPCGTGTSAKLACLYADGKLAAGERYRQAGILGSIFEGSVAVRGANVYPRVGGKAYINAEAHLVIDEQDPFAWGIRA